MKATITVKKCGSEGNRGWNWTRQSGKSTKTGKGKCPGQTANYCDIAGAVDALQAAADHNFSHIIIQTNSQYLINGATQWRNKWKRNGWKKKKEQRIANYEIWRDLDDVLSHIEQHTKVEFTYKSNRNRPKPANSQIAEIANILGGETPSNVRHATAIYEAGFRKALLPGN